MSDHRENEAIDQDVQSRLAKLERSSGGKWWRRSTITLIALAVSVPFAADALGPVPNTFSAGGVISASEMNANFVHLQNGITANENQVPSGAVAFFDADSCPTGWSAFAPLQGRVAVGTPSGGSLRAEVGTALENAASRTITQVPAHTHSADPPLRSVTVDADGVHSHTMQAGGVHDHTARLAHGDGGTGTRTRIQYAGSDGDGTIADSTIPIQDDGSHVHTINESSSHTHAASVDIPSFTTGSTGASEVDVTMPYVQLLACRRN